MRKINEIIVHCSATPEGRNDTVEDICRWHLERGFNDIGYHYVVELDGSVQLGRDIAIAGAHCLNHNSHSIGVCYIGGLTADCKSPKDTRTAGQVRALTDLIARLVRTYPGATVHGHNEFASKDCPCFDVQAEYGR